MQERIAGDGRAEASTGAADVPEMVDADGEALSEQALDELAAVAEVEAVAEADALAATRTALEVQRDEARQTLARYREAVLAAEPELPPELVQGQSLQELEQSLAAARAAVAQIRDRLGAESGGDRGFPAGAPARTAGRAGDLTAGEKIRVGLEQRARSR